jgi:diacylglycerol kinase (ATP)
MSALAPGSRLWDARAVTRSLVIINPHASRMRRAGAVESTTAELTRVLTLRDAEPPMVVIPDGPEDTEAHVRKALALGVTAVIGVGGDGTLKEIVTVLAGGRVPMGIVPGGTGNVLAGVLGVPSGVKQAIAALANARPRAIDLGEVRLELVAEATTGGDTSSAALATGRRAAGSMRTLAFAIGCGLGFDARVMSSTTVAMKRRLGRSAYFVQAARLAAGIDTVPYRISVDGEVFETEASIAMVTNMGELLPGAGPRLPIVPDDGLLDVFVLGARGPVAGVRGLIDHLRRSDIGANPGAGTWRLRGRRIRLESTPAEPMQVDGDTVGTGALEAVVRPGALLVLVPPGMVSTADAERR